MTSPVPTVDLANGLIVSVIGSPRWRCGDLPWSR